MAKEELPPNPLEVRPRKVLSAGALAGQKPPGVIQQEAELAAILSGEPEKIPVGVVEREQAAASRQIADPTPAAVVAEVPRTPAIGTGQMLPPRQEQRQLPTRRVKLRYSPKQEAVPGFVMEFDVYDTDVNDTMISVDLAHNFSFVPTDKMELVITIDGKDYPVIFLGGVLRFTKRNINAISFVRDEPEEPKS